MVFQLLYRDRYAQRLLCRRRGDSTVAVLGHEFQADYDRRSKQKLNETIESQKEELYRAQADERRRRDQQLLHEQLLKQNWDLREAHEKSLHEVEELNKFQSSTYDYCEKKISRRSRYYSGTYRQHTGIAK